MMDNNWELHSHYSADAVWNLALSPTDILGNALRSTMMDNYWELWPPDILGYALRSTTKDYYWELHALEIADHTCEEIAIWPMDILWGQMVILGSSHWEVLWTANAANHGQLADAEETASLELVAVDTGKLLLTKLFMEIWLLRIIENWLLLIPSLENWLLPILSETGNAHISGNTLENVL